MELLDKDEKAIGLQKVNDLFEKLKSNLKRIGEIENFLISSSIVISIEEDFQTFDEMEILINAELKDSSKSKFVLKSFKWMLIFFEALSGYLAVGLIMHALSAELNAEVMLTIKAIFAIAFSYTIITFAMNSIKSEDDSQQNWSKYFMAFGAIVALPVINVLMIYTGLDDENAEVSNKSIYVISLMFTVFTGSLLVLKSKEKSKKEEKRINKLIELRKILRERRSRYSSSRDIYLNIFKVNNKYEGILSNGDNSIEKNQLYSGLNNFIENYIDFDTWSDKFIDDVRKKQKNINPRNKFKTDI